DLGVLVSSRDLLEFLKRARNAVDQRDDIFAGRHPGVRFVALSGGTRVVICRLEVASRSPVALALDRGRRASVADVGGRCALVRGCCAFFTLLASEAPERFFERQDGVSWLAAVLSHRSTAVLMD